MKKYRSFLCVLLLLCAFVVPINVGNYKTESVVYAEGETSVSTKLTSLEITGYSNNLDPAFNSDTTNYTISVPSNVIDLDITFEKEYEDATVTITGNRYMKNTTGTIKIKVTAEGASDTTYTINYSKDLNSSLVGTKYNFEYTGAYQTWTATATARYKIELWGAQGGHITRTNNNGGGYTKGEMVISNGTTFYVFVGEGGKPSTETTYNGGGAGGTSTNNNAGFSGGGATDIRTYINDEGEWNDFTSLASRIMVAGAGGGTSRSKNNDLGGGKSSAGGLLGYSGGYYTGYDYEEQNGGGAGQIYGGFAGNNIYSATGLNLAGGFGYGGSSYSESTTSGSAGGGAGYYGGGAGGGTAEGGAGNGAGGGSSYISGHTGSVAITSEENVMPKIIEDPADTIYCNDGTTDVRCSYHYSGYKFTNTQIIDGQGYEWTTVKGEQIGTPRIVGSGTRNGNITTDDTMNGADGYARITYLSVPSDDNYLTSLTSTEGTFDKTFDPLENTYYLTIGAYTTRFSLNATTSDEYAYVNLPSEFKINLGETKRIQIFVTSASGIQRMYTVIATRSESELTTSSTKLKSLTLNDGEYKIDFEPLLTDYEIEMVSSVIDIDVKAITFDTGATVTIEGNEYMKADSGRIKITVSKDGLEDTVYRVRYTKVATGEETTKLLGEFTYTGDVQTYTVPYNSIYKIELWGASGGAACQFPDRWTGGYGAYTAGNVILSKDTDIYFYIGQAGSQCTTVTNGTYTPASWNGGGSGSGSSDSNDGGGSGGGATDVRIVDGNWDDATSLGSRIMVAAGGAGASYVNPSFSYRATGGGGVTGTGPIRGYDNQSLANHNYHGTQTEGYAFGKGQNGFPYAGGGGGGGSAGWYGGKAVQNGGIFPTSANYGASGSSYISGHTGCVGITATNDNSPKTGCASGTDDRTCSLSPYGYEFEDTIMIDGDGYSWTNVKGESTGMPTKDGSSTMTGNSGNGYAKISLVNVSNDNYLTSITANVGTFDKEFNPTTYVYNLTLDKYERDVVIDGVISDSTATAVGFGKYSLTPGQTKVVTIAVTSASGNIKNYTINITRGTLNPGEHNTKLSDLSINGYKFDIPFTSLTYIYNIEMSKNIYDLEVNAIPYDNTATITITGNKYMDSDYSVINIKVSSEGVEDTTYKIYCTKVDYSNAAELYTYTGSYETFVAPYDKEYLIELWGTSGGGSVGLAAYGGYTSGKIYLEAGTTFYIYVGQSGKRMNANGGATWNGGGGLTNYYNDSNNGSGGGATDIRLVPTSVPTVWDEFNSLKSRIMVAGSGAGYVSGANPYGYGGGLTSTAGAHTYSGTTWRSTAATQTSGYALGRGANSARAGGGGGYFGGYTTERSGAGGSSYISGHLGAVALQESSTSSNLVFNTNLDGTTCTTGNAYLPCSYHYSGYIFTDTVMIDGSGKNWTNVVGSQEHMPDPTGGYYAYGVGHSGNGYARITIPDVQSQNDYLDDLTFKKFDYSEDYLVDFGFDPLVNEYNITLDKYTRAFEISGELSDSNARVTGLGKYTIEPGDTKNIDVTVTAPDGNFRVYTLHVTRQNNGEDEHTNLLRNLQVDKYNLKEDFYSKKYDYTVDVYDTEIDLVINATPLDLDDQVSYTVTGNTYIAADTGTIKVKVMHVGMDPVTYTITYNKITPTMNDVMFNYTGEYQEWTAPFSAKYLIETWGAAGGGTAINYHTTGSSGGMGGYAGATFKILEGTKLYVYVGGKGVYGAGSSAYGGPIGGWNGGGNGGNSGSGSGGGATDVRMIPTSAKNIWNENSSLYSRIIVAGGGGGSDDGGSYVGTYGGSNDGCGGSGVGLKGQGACYEGVIQASYGGTQTEGCALGRGCDVTTSTDTGGGGGGYYGGLVTNYGNGGGGAGSSYIKNYPGADITYLEYQDGASYMSGEFKAAQNSDNGYANIKFLGIISDNVYLKDLTVTTDLVKTSMIDETFDPQLKDYTAYLDKYTELFYVDGALSDENSTVEGLGEYRIALGETKYIDVTVTAESGKTKTYTIKVMRADFEEGEHSTKLASLWEETYSLKENFYSEKYDYRMNVYGNEIDTFWHYTTYDPDAIVTIEGDKYLKGHNVITITVSLPDELYDEEDPSTYPTTYEVVFTKVATSEPSKNYYLKELNSSVGTLSPDFVNTTNTYTIHLDGDQNGTRLTGKADDSRALVTGLDRYYTVEPGRVLPVDIVVTSDHGETKTYHIDISRDAYDDSTPSTKLKSLVITGYETDIDFQSNTLEYDIVLPKGEIDLTINAVPYDEDAVVTVENSKHIDQTEGTITVTVSKSGLEDTVYIINYVKYDSYGVTYDYTGNYITFTAPYTGKYTFELWGAQGGKGYCSNPQAPEGGKGAYTSGTITLDKGKTVYIYVGSVGASSANGSSIPAAGWNGGGPGTTDDSASDSGGAGGGATDVRLIPGAWNDERSLASRIMVAAGGGGSHSTNTTNNVEAMAGGTLAVTGQISTWTAAWTPVVNQTTGFAFGYGKSGESRKYCHAMAGGGGGYYGGENTIDGSNCSGRASGGSSYISGHLGSVAITSMTDLTPRKDVNEEMCVNGTSDITCSYHYSGYVFTDTKMISGNSSQPTHDGASEQTGNAGNGYAKVSMELSQDAYLNDLSSDYGTWSASFDSLLFDYELHLNQYEAYVNLTGVLSNPNATVTNLDRMYELELGDSKVIPIVVTAPNGDTKTYTVTIHRDNYTDEHSTKLSLLNVVNYEEGYLDPKFTPIKNNYEITIDSSEAEIHVDYIPFDETATVTVSGDGRIIGENGVINVRVSAAGCEDTLYTISYRLESIPAGTDFKFSYTGEPQKFIVPTTGLYQLETWGAQGGGRSDSFNNSNLGYGGAGGYSTGELKLYKDQILYVYVGGVGSPSNAGLAIGGFNGGGASWASDSGEPAAGGGGATDIRTEYNNLYTRFIVAGGGGGGGEDGEAGGIGGGTTGGNGGTDCYGTQTAGRCGAVFGSGASTPYDGGGGGGGWYGGGTAGGSQTIPTDNSGSDTSGGSGGSGFVLTSSTVANVPSGYKLDNQWYLSNAKTIAGNAVMPTTDHQTIMYGKGGNGYALITLLDKVSRNNYLVSLTTDYGVLSPSFETEKQEYTLTLDAYSPKFTLSGVAADPDATISGLGTYSIEPGGTKTINISVTASAGDIRVYKVNVRRDAFTDAHSSLLSNLTINSGLESTMIPVFNSKVYEYNIDLYYNLIDLDIGYTTYDEDAVVTVEDNLHIGNTGIVTIRVNCPTAGETVYHINYTKNRSLADYVPGDDDVITEFGYTGNYQTFIAPDNGDYIIELWGAQGNHANRGRSVGGAGGYTYGIINLEKGEKLYVYVGENRLDRSASWNAGTTGGGSSDTTNGGSTNGYGGGGATDVRLTAGSWNDVTSLRSRIMVAGGGGGASDYAYPADGGAAGGLIGSSGNNGKYPTTGVVNIPATGGTQTSGGVTIGLLATGGAGANGSFGAGGNGNSSWGAGGGGGYYGGGGAGHTSNSVDSAAGGSSYISGYLGSVAIVSASSTSPRTDLAGSVCNNGTTDITCSYHYSGKIFRETKMLAGNQEIPNKSGTGTSLGNTGSGYAKITQILKDKDNYLQTLTSSYGVLKQKEDSSKDFDPLVNTYTLTLSQYDTSFTLSGTLSHDDATMTGLGYYEIELGETYDVEVVVTSENGTAKTYTVTVTRSGLLDEHSTKLKELSLLDSEAINGRYGLNEEFNSLKYDYTTSLYSNVIDLTVNAIPYDSAARVEVRNNLYMTNEEGTITVRVYIPDSDVPETYYYIDYNKEIVEGADIVQNYNYTGQYQTFNALVTGNYKVQLWGASGGIGRTNSSLTNMAGRGAYTEGVIKLDQGTKLYVYVGQKGYNGRDNGRYLGGYGGWNGGGQGGNDANHDSDPDEGGGGGGATDIRLTPTSALTAWNETTSLVSRIMVAGGGSGSTYGRTGFAGGLWQFNNPTYAWNFGYGRSGFAATSGSEGGGGGYWGGNSQQCDGCEGYGGSSYISGHPGQIAITSPTDLTARLGSSGNVCALGTTDPLCSEHYSGYVFKDTIMLNGNEVMPNKTNTGTMTGNQESHGYAIITPLFYSRDYYLTDITATTIENNTMFPEFDPLTDTYSITMDKYDEWITLDATLSDPDNSIVAGLGEYRLFNPGDELTVPLIVTAKSGETKTYTVYIHRNDFETHTTKLKDLDIIGSEDTIEPRFHSLNYEYDIPLSAGIIDVALNAIPYDENVTVTYSTLEDVNKIVDNNIYYLKDDIGTIIITVSLPDEMVDEDNSDTLPTTYVIRYNKNDSYNGGIAYNGSYTKWVVPTTGYYYFELWGASGGYDRQNNKLVAQGGLGAYTAGKIYVPRGTEFYIYVGGAGGNAVKSGYAAGGYNGGGRGDYDHADDDAAGGGGGATDVRTYISSDAAWNNFDSLKSRIMVAAGGAGMPAWDSTPAGGGLYAYGSNASPVASQTTGYAFGYGAPGTYRTSNTDEAGGGGGYYGGGVTSGAARRQGSGSSFISGHAGADAISEDSTSDNIIHTGQPNHYSGYVFTDTVMIDGYGYNWTTDRDVYVGMPKTSGTGIQTGQSGNGYAKITSLDQDNYLLGITVKIDKKFKLTDDDNTIWDNVEGAVYSPEFDKFTDTYTLELPDHVTSLTLGARASSDNATVEGLGVHEVFAGENRYPITVTAESGEEKVYTLVVTRPASHESRATDIDVTGFVETLCKPYEDQEYCKLTPASYSPDNTEYYVTVPSGIRDLEWTVTKMHEYQEVYGAGVTRLGPWLNMITIEVESELCADYKRHNMMEEYEACTDVTDYTYYVTRDMTGDNYIDELEIYDPEVDINFDYLLTEYTFKVPNEYTELGIRVKLDDPNATYEIIGNENFEVGVNIVEIVVTAANGEVRTYVLNVYRLANGNKLLSELHVTNGTTEFTLNPPFEDITTSYTLDVPNEITSINVSAVAAYNKTRVTGTGTYNLNTGLNQIHVITTAENGETETYTIVVNRAKSDNAYLKVLSALEGSFNETYVKTENNYTMTVNPYTKKLNINAIVDEPNATYRITGNDNFKIGPNTVKIIVTAENGKTNTYTIVVTKLGSEINTLRSLTTNRGEVTPTFDPEVTSYSIIVANNITDINVSGEMTDALSKVTGFGTYRLTTGDNVIEITVTSETGVSRVYTVNVFREYNGNYYLRSLTVSNGTLTPTFDRETTHYTVNVDNDIEKITIKGLPEVNTTSVDGNGTYSLIVGDNTFVIRATAENGTHLMYTVTVTRDRSSNSNLSNLLIKEARIKPAFNPMITSYTARVLYDIEDIHVVATPVDPDATVEITGTEGLTVGNNTVTVKVTAPDGTEKVYEVIVTRLSEEESPNLFLESLNVSGCEIEFNKRTYNYECTVVNEVTQTTIEATAEEDTNEVIGTGIFDLIVGHNYKQIVVTDGEFERIYTIDINRLKSTESRLKNIIINDHTYEPEFNSDVRDYYVETSEYELDLSFIKIHEGTTVEVTGNDNMSVGNNDIVITTTSEDGEHHTTYTLHVTRLIRNDNYLSNLWVEDYEIAPEFTKEITNYKVFVPYETTGVIIGATVDDRNATVEGTGLKTLMPGPNTATIRVRAEDGTVREYRIIVTRAASPNNYLESLTIEGETYTPDFDKNRQTYSLAVPYETDSINITAIPEDPEASIIGDGIVPLKQGINNVEVYVVAPNGNVRTYTIKVTRRDPITAKLLNIEVENYTLDPLFTPDNTLYQVTVDYETTKLNFIITKMDPYSTYEIVGNRNFKIGINEVLINVTSSNRIDTMQYKVIVNRQAYSNTFLSSLTVSQGELTPVFNKNTLTYNVEVANGVEYITIDGSPDYPLSRVTGFGDYRLNVGTNQIPIVVTSPSGIKRTYNVIVNRKKSSNANITSIKANIGTLTKDDDYTYTLVVPKYTTNIGKANFIVTPEDPTATVSMPVTIDLSRTTAYPIKITSPDGTRTKEYTVNVVFDLSHDNTLASLIPSVGELNPEFDPKVNNYRIDLYDDETEEFFDLYLNEVEATLLNRSLTYQLTDLETIADISVQAEDGKVNTYHIVIAKSLTKEKYVDNITVTGIDPELGVTIPSFRSKTFEYEFEVPYEVSSVGFDVTKRHPAQQVKVYKDDVLLSGSSYSLDVGVNNLEVRITNSLGEVTTYSYTITRKSSTNAHLRSLGLSSPKINIEAFDREVFEYDLVIPYEYEDITINAIPEVEGSRIVTNGTRNLTEGEERDVTITVTAPDNITKLTYVINVLREPEVNNLLKNITVSTGDILTLNPKFRPGNSNYTLTVRSTASDVQVDALPFEDYTVASGNVGNVPLNIGDNSLTIVSTATVDGRDYVRRYNINVFRPSMNDALLENIKVLNGTMVEPFTKTNDQYTVNVANDVTSLNLVVKTEDPAAIYTITGNNDLGYGKENLVTIKVTAADGLTSKSYYLHVSVKGEANPYLFNLKANNEVIGGFNKYIEEYNLKVENATNYIDIEGIPESEFSTVTSGNGRHNLEVGENVIDIVVTAQDGETTKTYTINVTREEDAYLNYLATDQTGPVPGFEKTTYDYEVTVENDVEEITILGMADDFANAEVTGNGKYSLKVGDNPVYIAVRNGSTRKVYTVNIKRKGSSNTNLLYLTSTDGDLEPLFDNSIDEYVMHLPNYKTKLALAYEAEHNATVTVVDNDLVAPESTVKVIVTAEDGTLRTIEIKVYLEDGGYFNSRLANLEVSEGTISPKFDPDNYDYTLTVNQDVTTAHIIATPEESTSTISGDGPFDLELGRNKTSVVVTALDGTTTTYNLIIFRKDMDNADLTGLYTDIGELDPEFSPKIYNYTIKVPEETRKVHLTAVAYSEKNIVGDGDVYLHKGITTRNITVTSESGVVNTYVVNIDRDLSTNHDITSITESTGEMSPTYDAATLNYSLKVGDVKPNLDKTYVVTNHVVFDVKTYSELAEVIYEKEVITLDENENEVTSRITLPSNDVSLDYGNNRIIIYAMSEDGNTSDEYVFDIYRIHDLTDITVPGDATGPAMLDGSPNHISVQPGGTFDLLSEIGYTPEDADFKDLIFRSNNTSLVTVNADGIITAADVLDKSTTITVTSKYYPNIVKTVNVTVEITLITSDVYTIEREKEDYDQFINYIELKTSLDDFLNNLDNDRRFLHVYDLDGNEITDYSTNAGTGFKVTLENNGHTYDYLYLVVYGDINGDGYSNTTDLNSIKDHIVRKSILTGIKFLASDISEDGYTNTTDLNLVKNYIVRKITSFFE